jgi:hypothetical protein
MGVEGLVINLSPLAKPTTQTHIQFVFINMASTHLPFQLLNHPQILKFDLLSVDMASTQLPLQPIVHKSSCHKLTPFFFFFGIIVYI